jgi:hypothetical protein
LLDRVLLLCRTVLLCRTLLLGRTVRIAAALMARAPQFQADDRANVLVLQSGHAGNPY